MQMATQVLSSQLNSSSSNNENLVQSVIGDLLGGSGKEGIDFGSLLQGLQGNGLADVAKSWLGDGANENISSSQIESLLGSSQVQEAAAKLGASQSDLLTGLQQMIPQVVDKSSSGGELLDSVGGLSGLAGLASKFLK